MYVVLADADSWSNICCGFCTYLLTAAMPVTGAFTVGVEIIERNQMGRQVANVLYLVAMVAIIVGVDFAFFRNRLWERLAVNVGIVLGFVDFYFRVLRRQ